MSPAHHTLMRMFAIWRTSSTSPWLPLELLARELLLATLLEPTRALLEVAAHFEPAARAATCSRSARFAGIRLVAPLAVD